MTADSLLLRTLSGQDTQATPIWLMRQAGRYLPEYRKIREQAGSFLNLCRNPELAATVTLQPISRFPLDAAIIFSDILVIPNALGMELEFIDGDGPRFMTPLTTAADVEALNLEEMLHKLDYVFSAIKQTKTRLQPHIPLIGFSGSPFTLACYMLEGKSSRNYLKTKEWLYNQPELMHTLLHKLTQAVIRHLQAQIVAGVDVVMLFDSFGGVLTDVAYQEFSFQYLKQIISAINSSAMGTDKTPIILFTKGSGAWLDVIKTSQADVIGLDWMTNIATAKNILGHNVVLQGNLDPAILAAGDKHAIKAETMRILHSYQAANNGNISGHVFNLGHGILPTTNPDHVAYLIDLVHNYK